MKRALVLMAQGTEELEVVTVIDVLRRGGVEVVVAGLSDGPITASRGVRLLADVVLSTQRVDDFDALVLPGGNGGTECFEASELVLSMIQQAARTGILLAAICAAPRALNKAGVLSGKRVTSYPGALDPHSTDYAYLEQAVVQDGALVTSRGPGTALDFALTLVELLCGKETRDRVELPLVRVS